MNEAVTKQQVARWHEVLEAALPCGHPAHARTLAEMKAFIESPPSAPRAEAVEAQKPAAYLTRDEEGEPEMLFFDLQEARTYCYPDDEPEPLFLRLQGTDEGERG